jgi:TPR repeat protein
MSVSALVLLAIGACATASGAAAEERQPQNADQPTKIAPVSWHEDDEELSDGKTPIEDLGERSGEALAREPADDPDAEEMKKKTAIARALCADLKACNAGCTAGDGYACEELGWRYWEGKGVPADSKKALALFQKSCDGGTALGCKVIAQLNGQAASCGDETECAEGCSHSLDTACIRAGDFAQRQRGIARAKAVGYFRKACDDGFAQGCNALGATFLEGRGVARDSKQSTLYFKKACDAGMDEACANVTGVECITANRNPAKRDASLDPFCNPHRGRAARPGEPMPIKAYAAGDASRDFESEACFQPMRTIGCTSVRAHRVNKSAWCCP